MAPSAMASASIGESSADGDKIMVGSTTILKFTYHDYLDEVFQRQMYESALRDGLTKVFNKKYFTDYLEKEFAFADRHGGPLALIFMDIDYFKKINDTYGHPAGDQVLADLSQLMSSLLRTEDVLARFGGEEFTVLCRGSDLVGAQVVADRLRRAAAEHKFTHAGREIPVTISLGVVAIPESGISRPQRVPGCRRQSPLRGQTHRTEPGVRPRNRADTARAQARGGVRPPACGAGRGRRYADGLSASPSPRRAAQRSRAAARIAAAINPTEPARYGARGSNDA